MARTLSTSLPGPQSFVHDSSSEDIDDGKRMELANRAFEDEATGTGARGDDVKILCVCDGGSVRSAALASVLKHHMGHEAIAIGRQCVSRATMVMMCEWADSIAIMHDGMIESIPDLLRPKIVNLEVGEDRWGLKIDPELKEIMLAKANSNYAYAKPSWETM